MWSRRWQMPKEGEKSWNNLLIGRKTTKWRYNLQTQTYLLWPIKTHPALQNSLAILDFILEFQNRSFPTPRRQFSNLRIHFLEFFIKLSPLLSGITSISMLKGLYIREMWMQKILVLAFTKLISNSNACSAYQWSKGKAPLCDSISGWANICMVLFWQSESIFITEQHYYSLYHNASIIYHRQD